MVLTQDNYIRYYDKAMRLRRLIKESLEFDKYEVITSTTHITHSTHMNIIYLSRLCGLPAVTTPEQTYVANVGCEDILEAFFKEDGNEDITV